MVCSTSAAASYNRLRFLALNAGLFQALQLLSLERAPQTRRDQRPRG